MLLEKTLGGGQGPVRVEGAVLGVAGFKLRLRGVVGEGVAHQNLVVALNRAGEVGRFQAAARKLIQSLRFQTQFARVFAGAERIVGAGFGRVAGASGQ